MDEIWDLIGSVSEGFPTYFFIDILDTNKASGPDLISNKMIKKCIRSYRHTFVYYIQSFSV